MKFSRLSVLLTAAVVATSVLASTSKAHALTYNLVNVRFGNSIPTATGSFDYDPNTSFYNNISINYSGQPGPIPIIFNQSNFFSGNGNSLILESLIGTLNHRLDFRFNPLLGSSSSVIIPGINNSSYSNFDSVSQDSFVSYVRTGSSVVDAATVPFNIPGGATIPAVGGLLALGLMRKARKSLALNTRISKPISEVVS